MFNMRDTKCNVDIYFLNINLLLLYGYFLLFFFLHYLFDESSFILEMVNMKMSLSCQKNCFSPVKLPILLNQTVLPVSQIAFLLL